MTQRSTRAGIYRKARKLSKYETQLEDAFKQKRVHTTTDIVETLTYVPDVIVIPDGSNSTTDVTLPTDYFDEDKQVLVVNKDAAETPDVGGVTCAAASLTVLYFNGTAWAVLYEQDGVTTT